MKDLGTLKYFLGIKIARTKQGIYPYQRKYALDILSNARFLWAKPLGFPMEQNYKLGKAKSPFLPRLDSYCSLVGHLIYLTFTCPDPAYSIQVLSQFMCQAHQDHWDVALQVFCYVKHIPGQELLLC